MVDVALALFGAQAVQHLLFARRAECHHAEHLRLSAREDRGAVGTRQQSRLARDRANVLGAAAVRPDPLLENLRADVLLQLFLEEAGDLFGALRILRAELGDQLLLHGGKRGLARGLIGVVDGRLEARLDEFGDGFGQLLVFRGRDELALGLASLRGQLTLHLDQLLDGLVALADRLDHRLFGQLLGAGLDHHHRLGGASHGEVEQAVLQLRLSRIDDDAAVNVADAHAADRAGEGNVGDGERRRGAQDAEDIGIVLHVCGEHGDDDLDIVAIALGEERANGAVDQTRGEDRVLGGAAFALDEAAGNLARGIEPLFDVDGEGEEIDAFTREHARRSGGQNDGFAVAHDHGATSLLGDTPRFDAEGAAGDGPFDLMNGIHILLRMPGPPHLRWPGRPSRVSLGCSFQVNCSHVSHW